MGYIMVYPSSVFLKRGDMMIDKSGIRYALFSEKKQHMCVYIYICIDIYIYTGWCWCPPVLSWFINPIN